MEQIIGLIHNEPIPSGQPNWESSADVLAQVEAIERALADLGRASRRIAFTRDLERFVKTVRKSQISIAVNLCETVDDDPQFAGHPAAVLELLGLPFSGSSSAAIISSTDKHLAKLLLKGAGIQTPCSLLYDGSFESNPETLHFPVILKPQLQDASIGIDQESVIVSAAQLCARSEDFYRTFGPFLVEEFVGGREFNVSVIGNSRLQVMPIAEIDFSGFPQELFKIVGYRAKWDADSVEYRETRRIFPALSVVMQKQLATVARRCYRLFGLRDYGRIDIRVDGEGRVYVLEVNANPCLSPDAGFAAAALQAGIDYRGMIDQLLKFLNNRCL
jgi:D-alanine-D-alanine ligase